MQEFDCEQFSLSQGLSPIAYFRDIGSGNDMERGDLQNMFAFCKDKQNQVKYIVLTSKDRLMSSLNDFYAVEKKLEALNIKILSLEEQNIKKSEFNLNRNIFAALAQYENELKSERTKQGMKYALKQGKWLWRAPFGYINDRNKRNIVPDKTNSKIVKAIFTEVIQGTSYPDLLLYLEDCLKIHIQPKVLIKMLTNPIYCGYIYKPDWFDDLIKGSFKPIISTQLFNAVQDIIQNPEW